MNRRIAALLPHLIDVLAFCVLAGAGLSLRAANAYALAIGFVCSALWRWRIRSELERDRSDWLRFGITALLTLFLRAGVLALLTQRWGWAPQLAIFAAVGLGFVVSIPILAGRNLSLGLIVYSMALRLVYAGSVELLPEETYYWNYSRHLDFGYLDHPPMVAWLIKLGTAVFGQTEFGVRAGALCCGAVTLVFVYRLARNLFGQLVASAALLLVQALPFFFLAGFLMTPDAALTAAWAASLYFLERALIAHRPRAWWLAGICLGLGMISKYSIALLVPVTLVFMAWDPEARRWWRRSEPYVAALLALLIFSPVLIWNAQHEWISFAFQTSRRLAETPQFALHKLIGSIIVLITPTGFVALAAVLLRRRADAADAARRRRFIRLAILIPLAVVVAFSLRHEVKLDWTGALMTAALPALACTMIATDATLHGFARKLRGAWMPTLVIMLLMFGAGLHYLVLGLPGAGYGKHIEVVPVGWRDLSARIMGLADTYQRANGSDLLIIGMDRYAIASELAFYGGAQRPAGLETANSYLFGGMGLMYSLWVPPQSQEHRNLLLVAFSPQELEDKSVTAQVSGLGPIVDEVLARDGVIIRHYYHRLAFDYRPVETRGE
ncbi:MAG: glycosyltransferase family 39 protein [Pseudomonadota bacterium]|nr:glycosyltransferase family 39 protein [Pseudomonadota bacterium]